MRKFFKKLFNLDRVEVLQAEVSLLKKMLEEQNERTNKQISALDENNRNLREELYGTQKMWKGVKQPKERQIYYVVTQGGYHQIMGWKLNKGVMSEVTRRAFKNGFVVETEVEAERLQQAIKKLGW